MELLFGSLRILVCGLAAALIVVPATWGESASSSTKALAHRLLSAANPYVLDGHGIIATAPDFEGLIAEIRQGMVGRSRNMELSIKMTAIIAESPSRNELAVLGEFSSRCSITPSEFLDDYQKTRGQQKEIQNRSSLAQDLETIWKLYSFLTRKTSIQPQWAIVCGNGSDPRWKNALGLPSSGFQFQTVNGGKGREYAYYVDRSGVAFFF
ncbi:MAG: hypothetical protein P8171_07615 [Candidatus Thiodiazotropha sp.]